ncbi:MAG TPA: hypothetical protein VFR04_04310 [Solirubrobacterales bacterium]|nr:hypothetical protein [Solirubrobacterales bacterium]
MASKDGEHKMLFDLRGRRKNVVKVVYAILALLMGASLFLVIGPAPISDLFGGGGSGVTAASQLEEQAERIERKLKKDPDDPELLLAVTRARINAGNALAVVDPETQTLFLSTESRQQMALASESWSKYLKATDEPSIGGAQQAAQTFYGLAQISTSVAETQSNLREAERAQQLVAEARPSFGSLSTLAIYRYYSFDYEGADKARKQAVAEAQTKFQREELATELDQIKGRAENFQRRLAQAEKEADAARKRGEPAPNPLAEGNPLSGG